MNVLLEFPETAVSVAIASCPPDDLKQEPTPPGLRLQIGKNDRQTSHRFRWHFGRKLAVWAMPAIIARFLPYSLIKTSVSDSMSPHDTEAHSARPHRQSL
jgi:hypothetical protein